uniref:DUF753 domain-containing protein n=1 Tax=Anopheles farauti TaxID=69004 RepID=A0A182QY44_9DIPT
MTSARFSVCVVLLFTIITRAHAFQCMQCIAQGSERNCDESGDSMECNEELAEKYISMFMRVNEDLDVDAADKTRYKCFKFSLKSEEAFYLKGCTYESLPICDNMQDGMHCSTCTGKDCNHMYYESYYDESGRAAGRTRSSRFWASMFRPSMVEHRARFQGTSGHRYVHRSFERIVPFPWGTEREARGDGFDITGRTHGTPLSIGLLYSMVICIFYDPFPATTPRRHRPKLTDDIEYC